MTVIRQKMGEYFAAYHGDCCEVLPELPDESVHMSIYSPPFADLYNYSSDDRDMSNCTSYAQFLEHYGFLVREIHRLTVQGRMSIVHCMDLKKGPGLQDFPGDIIRLHEKAGFIFHSRHVIWKEPLKVAIRTRSQGLMHKQIVKDSILCRVALPDYILAFRKRGINPIPVKHPEGLSEYVGGREVPSNLNRYLGGVNPLTNEPWLPKENKRSHWIWQKYASAFWDDIRNDRVLPYKPARDKDDEKHVCPLQLDVIERCLVLWSNPGETVLTPFMGIGSEVYAAMKSGRKGIGVELKASYFRQALRNIESIIWREEDCHPADEPRQAPRLAGRIKGSGDER